MQDTYQLVLDAPVLHERVDVPLPGGRRFPEPIVLHEGCGGLTCAYKISCHISLSHIQGHDSDSSILA